MGRVNFRLRMRRPEVGFDLDWSWGPWEDVVRSWRFESVTRPGADFYWESSKEGVEQSFELDQEFMAAEAARLRIAVR